MPNNEWYTPPIYIEAARRVMGGIDLDPASCDKANQYVQAYNYYDKKMNGLDRFLNPWYGNVWLNPPYSRGLIGAFTDAVLDAVDEDVKQLIMLVNSSTSTKWYQLLLNRCDCFCLPSKRVAFLDSDGIQQKSQRYDNTFFYFGENCEKFKAEFSQFGKVCKVIS